jgi:hypothetical protein
VNLPYASEPPGAILDLHAVRHLLGSVNCKPAARASGIIQQASTGRSLKRLRGIAPSTTSATVPLGLRRWLWHPRHVRPRTPETRHLPNRVRVICQPPRTTADRSCAVGLLRGTTIACMDVRAAGEEPNAAFATSDRSLCVSPILCRIVSLDEIHLRAVKRTTPGLRRSSRRFGRRLRNPPSWQSRPSIGSW